VQTLTTAGIATARLDCLVLLEDVLGMDRAQLLAHPEKKLTIAQEERLDKAIAERKTHRPLAYIRGKADFYGRTFQVNEHVLVPRPETEMMIDLLLQLSLEEHPKIADIGTGSGCLGITAALELAKQSSTSTPEQKTSDVWLCDIDPSALGVAQANATALNATVYTAKADLGDPCNTKQFDVVLANLPYVPDHFPVNDAATFEPKLALFSGADGLDAYRTFWQQLSITKYKPSFILTESLPFQHHPVALLARKAGFALERSEGLIQLFNQI